MLISDDLRITVLRTTGSDGREDGGHGRENVRGRKDLAGKIDEHDVDTRGKELLLEAVGLPDAAFEEIALDGALETALGNRDQDARGGTGLRTLTPQETVAETTADTALATVHELCNRFFPAEALGLGKGGHRHGYRFFFSR